MTKIKEIKEPTRYLSFQEAAKNFTMEEIYKLAEATYLLQVQCKGGVIE